MKRCEAKTQKQERRRARLVEKNGRRRHSRANPIIIAISQRYQRLVQPGVGKLFSKCLDSL